MELQLLEMPKNDQLLHKIIDYKKEWEWLKTQIMILEVNSIMDSEKAHDVMKKTQKLLKDAELVRKTIVQPFNDQVKTINNLAKMYTADLEDAKAIAKQKIVDFELRQEAERQKEIQKVQQICSAVLSCKDKQELDAKIIKIEENWYIAHADVVLSINTMIQKFEDQIRIQKEKEDQEKEQARLDELKKANDQEAIKLAEQQAKLEQQKRDQEAEKRKQEQLELEEQLAKKKQEEQEMIDLDRKLNKSKWLRKKYKFEVIDEKIVPRIYCTPSDKLIRDAIDKWTYEIPWLRIYEELSVQ